MIIERDTSAHGGGSTFVMTYNPLKWTWSGHAAAVEAMRRGDRVVDAWDVGARTSGIGPGDRFVLLQQGVDRGIIGHGDVISEIYEDEHWRPDIEGLARFVRLRFAWLVEAADRIPTEELVEVVDGVAWKHLQRAGTRVPADAESVLAAILSRTD